VISLSEFWDKHYLKFQENEPSLFCKEVVSEYLRTNDYVIEIGCGNGRDGLEIARKVKFYEGIDLSSAAVESARRRFVESHVPDSKFHIHHGDFSKIELDRLEADRIVVYSRFSLHSDTEESENSLISKLLGVQDNDLLVLIEVRTIHDELFGVGTPVGRNAFITDHYRRFIDPTELKSKISEDFRIIDFKVSDNFANYFNENPIVLRIAFQNMVTHNE
jgi:tellurite methyltransferase